MKLPTVPQKLIILGLVLLAFLLRAYRLDFQSYWIDEAWSVYFANLSPAQLWHLLKTVEPLPPFYHPSTIYWAWLVGDSEYAMRFYSLLFGVLAVPFTYRLGRALGDDRLGLLAALLMAVSPYQIWHSQEARMYSALTAASVMSMWGFANLYRRGGRRWRIVYIIGTVWAIMTHYHGVVLIGIQGLFLLLTWQRHRRVYLDWGATLVVVLLLQLPWLILGGNLLQSYLNWIEQPTLWDTYLRSAVAYSLNELAPRPQAIPLALVFVAAYLLGLFYATRRRWGSWRGPEMLAFLAAYTLAPNLAAWLYGEFRTTVYYERYLILVQVGYLLTIAVGVLAVADGLPSLISRFGKRRQRHSRLPARLAKFSAILLLLALIGLNGWVLYHHYYDPVYAKPNWRAVAQTVQDFGRPGDAVLLTGDGGEHAFNYYYHGSLPVYYPFNISPHHQQQRPTGDEARQILAGIAAKHQRLWYTPYGMHLDPILEGWLAEHAHPAWHSWLGRKRLALYATQAVTNRQKTLNVLFADASGRGPKLLHIAWPDEPTAAGDLLPLALTWQTEAPLANDYQLSLRLSNARGDIFTQSDWPPLTAIAPTSAWPPHQPLTDRRSLWLPPDVPPGDYTLQLVVYNPVSGQSLGQPVILSGFAVGPAQISPPLEALSIPNLGRRIMGNLTLAGYISPPKIQPGQEMWLWLYWQAKELANPDSIVRLSLRSGDKVVSADYPLAASIGPLASWQQGQVRRAVYHLPTSPRLAGQIAELAVALVLPDGRVEAETVLTQIELETRPRQFDVPAVDRPLDISFGDAAQIKLLGYNLPAAQAAPGDTLTLTLVWQAGAEMDLDYTVFVQLLNHAGQVAAQVDAPPLAGAAPTTTWLPGETLADTYPLALPADLSPGSYRLIAGLYHAPTGRRLPVSSGGDFVELPQVAVK
ncbi:MAG: glycosyltransferase family 39 protein [Anaerolineae bacterium]|nr:glycosyltransferase family 39 protein [Anaerolineae bacterium]